MARIDRSWLVILILSSMVLGACNLPVARQTENPFPTFAAQTVEARLTLAAEQNPPPDLPSIERHTFPSRTNRARTFQYSDQHCHPDTD